MASLFRLGDRWVCDLYGLGRVRLGKNKSDAAHHYRYIEKIEQAGKSGLPPEPAAVDWLRNAPAKLRKRLQTVGLISGTTSMTLGELVEVFSAQPAKPNSMRIRKNGTDNLLEFIAAEIPLIDIQPADAIRFKSWLLTAAKKTGKGQPPAGLGQATAARRIKWARGAFKLAAKNNWIASNPFSDVKAGRMTNPSKAFFVSPEITNAVMAQLPDIESRLIFALGRWGGLRLPSEATGFRWDGVNWDRWSMTFASPKTEGHEGKEFRTVPIFRELQPIFQEARAAAPADADYICPMLRSVTDPRQVIDKFLTAALKSANVERWPRLLTNLRATRATEIDALYGSKAESEWIGHGAETALAHYVMVTDDHWRRAVS